MTPLNLALGALALGFLVAGAMLWLERRRLLQQLLAAKQESDAQQQTLDSTRWRLAEANSERAALAERLNASHEAAAEYEKQLERRLGEFQDLFTKTIETSAGRAMKDSSEQILSLAQKTFTAEQEKARAALDSKVQPINDTLKRTHDTLSLIEKERLAAYERLAAQMRQVGELSKSLSEETGNLVKALRKPQVRGRWGEMQLRNVAELAGMKEHCDFSEQESSRDDAGALKRPDMIVNLPNGRRIVVDAKTNIEAYLDAIEAPDPDTASQQLDRFARHVADQAAALAKKDYWSQYPGAHEFVVMFVPGEQFIDAAHQRRPELLTTLAEQGVILASPSTLIALLRAVYLGWREQTLAGRAEELFRLGRELHTRAAVAFEHADALGNALGNATDRYNKFVGSLERQVLPTLRKFEEADAKGAKSLPDLAPIEATVRSFKAIPAHRESPE